MKAGEGVFVYKNYDGRQFEGRSVNLQLTHLQNKKQKGGIMSATQTLAVEKILIRHKFTEAEATEILDYVENQKETLLLSKT